MTNKKNRAAFVGVGQSRIFRHAELPLGLLADEACRAAISDAGLKVGDIDGIACVPNQPFEREGLPRDGIDFVTKNFVLKTLGIEARWGANTDMILGQSLIEAINAVEAGMCNYALVFRALNSPKGKYGRTSGKFAFGPAQYMAPYGRYPISDWAPMWHRYQDKYGTGSREQMATLVTQARRYGLRYEGSYWAQQQAKELTVDDYLNARVATTPFTVYDCDIPVHGAGAFVITTAERAADLQRPPAHVLGRAGVYLPAPETALFQGFTLERQQYAGRKVATDLWAGSGLNPSEIDTANLYDGFSIISMLWLETLGFCGEGEAFEFIQDGRITMEGELPLNTNGGSLGGGRMHGVHQMTESIFQVTDRAGMRQVKDAKVVATTIGTPSWSASAFLLGRDALD